MKETERGEEKSKRDRKSEKMIESYNELYTNKGRGKYCYYDLEATGNNIIIARIVSLYNLTHQEVIRLVIKSLKIYPITLLRGINVFTKIIEKKMIKGF